MGGEFETIARYFAPLAAKAPGAAGLENDAAVFAVSEGFEAVVTVDAMIAGVHFLEDDQPDLVGRKLLRVNLSDLAAMGARPLGYVMTTAFPKGIDAPWLERFVAGLAADQKTFDVSLLGGDTVSTPGPMALTLTALGEVEAGRGLVRSGARPGDLIYVSGTIGDGALGLLALTGRLSDLAEADRMALAERYRLPRPRLALGRALVERALATAALDVSDGLIGDLAHITETSGVGARLEAEAVPLSPAARRSLEADPERLSTILTGGDDYELLFTVPPGDEAQVAAVAAALGLGLHRIGVMVEGSGIVVLDARGQAVSMRRSGWQHF